VLQVLFLLFSVLQVLFPAFGEYQLFIFCKFLLLDMCMFVIMGDWL